MTVARTIREAARPAIELENVLSRRLDGLVAAARQSRAPLSLLFVEIDGYSDIARRQGPVAAERTVRLVGEACRTIEMSHVACLQTREARFAIVLPEHDRDQGLRFGQQLLRTLRNLHMDDHGAVTVSAGLATAALPSKNFAAVKLIEAADRCLYAAQQSDGDAIKSIAVY